MKSREAKSDERAIFALSINLEWWIIATSVRKLGRGIGFLSAGFML
jgi:hypothetical protein